MSALADDQNPWLGLASYGEAEREFFFGREGETAELLRLVEDETLVVLYGVSGLGKTSLLQAGLTPKLNAHDFRVWNVRLDHAAPDRQRQRWRRFPKTLITTSSVLTTSGSAWNRCWTTGARLAPP